MEENAPAGAPQGAAAATPGERDGDDPVATLPTITFALDTEFRYLSFNAAHAAVMKAIYGVDIELGSSLLEAITVPEDRETARANVVRALAGERIVREALSGDPAFARHLFRVQHDPIPHRGSVIGVAVLAEDVTNQRRAEAHQRRLYREMRAISRCNEVMIRVTDEQELLDEVCRIVCDDAGYRLAWVGYVEHDEAKTIRPVASAGAGEGELERSGITWAETPRGMGPTGVAARTGRTSFIQNLETDPLAAPWREDARRFGRRAAVALPLKDEDAVTFGVLSICTMDETFGAEDMRLLEELAGDLAFGIGTIRARAAQRDLEAQLRQAQKMEVIGQLAGGIAHDFNNLLTAIRGYSELLGAGLLPSQKPALSDLGEILAAVGRAEVLTRQLLAFARRRMLQPQVVVPGDVVSHVAPMLRRLLGEHVTLVAETQPGAGAVLVDPGQLEQVIVNLAVNARDAMPHGGRLVISVDAADVGPAEAAAHVGASAGRHVVLTVADDGTGMDADTQAHLFEPFFTTKPTGRGTGLGLATVYGIVRQSRGFISVRSAPGEGATFRVYLPVATTDSHPATSAAGALPVRGSGTVLLVEDDPAVRSFAVRALESFGYSVLAAADGDEALQQLSSHDASIDLLLTDALLPGMQGPEVARRVRAERPSTPVLFMSGFADMSPALAALTRDAPLLHKPFSIDELAVAVRDAMAQAGGA
jgi:signal transduction histidine kinase/CheY-like chemotaxis protein